MALPAEKDLSRKRGDTKRHVFTITSTATNQAIDISNWTSFVLAVNSEKAPIDITTEIGKMTGSFVTDGTDGKIYFQPPGTWASGNYFYDAQAVDANGEKCTFVQGKYTIVQDIAKD